VREDSALKVILFITSLRKKRKESGQPPLLERKMRRGHPYRFHYRGYLKKNEEEGEKKKKRQRI